MPRHIDVNRMRVANSVQAIVVQARATGMTDGQLETHLKDSIPYEKWRPSDRHLRSLWLNEISLQLGLKKPRPRRNRIRPSQGQLNLPIPDPSSKPSTPESHGPTGAPSSPASSPSAKRPRSKVSRPSNA